MKKRLLAIFMAAFALFSLSACGKSRIKTELPMENIQSMMVNGYGDLYLLTDTGIRYYAMSTDKEVDYIYGKDEINEAQFQWEEGGETISYGSLKIDKLLSAGEEGVTIIGRYMTNTSGRDSDLFVVQDVADLNVTAALFREIKREESKTPVINGIGASENGMYYKLNRSDVRSDNYNKGVSLQYSGIITAFDVPDDVTGAVEKEDQVYFLIENRSEAKILSNGEEVFSFDKGALADAFVSGGAVYAAYKDGRVTRWTVNGGEEEFKDFGVSLNNLNDTFLWEDRLYWFDKEGVKTVK